MLLNHCIPNFCWLFQGFAIVAIMVRHYTQALDVFDAFARGGRQVFRGRELILEAWNMQRNAFV